jgi:hypothetical protein
LVKGVLQSNGSAAPSTPPSVGTVQAAALGGAVVVARRAMLLDEPVTTATSSASTQFNVEHLEMTSVELVDALAAKSGLDASLDVADVRAAGGVFEVDGGEPGVDRLTQ